ncbi:class II fumarate hydratase [Candidatus Zinderia endosymbiont of Aphrophora alni]|uniref:class II fumarate hydratase n=1 Tax=Candidatus Zinderia endosymbiont of Aphrophora alni TaxID=3077951 RepID=UPI0030D62018
MKFRIECDSIGCLNVPFKRLWGAQTQRSLKYFKISFERMPSEVIKALIVIKRSCAKVNFTLGLIDKKKSSAIIKAADEIILGKYKDEFPLLVWQTGSGTQSNMNVNEVLANLGSKILGGELGKNRLIHPNDDVNKGQSSNDVFPTAMHISSFEFIKKKLIPSLEKLIFSLKLKSEEFKDIIKIGRTHLQDAIPLTLGQEFSAYVSQLEYVKSSIIFMLEGIKELAIGGTAVGTGFNTHINFDKLVVKELNSFYKCKFKISSNKFSSLSNHDILVFSHGVLKTLSSTLMKIANDIRWLSSGPRCGLGEIIIPENEPGSSIMPGKINPTQCEVITMLCAQIFGNDVSINIGGFSGNFQLNVFKPLIIYNFLQSIRLLTDGMINFEKFCIKGIKANFKRINFLLKNSLMLVTALTPYIGYDKAAKIAKNAYNKNITLKKSALELGYISEEQFEKWINFKKMIKKK